MGITPYPAKERVGNEVCPGTGHENFNPSTVTTERVHNPSTVTTEGVQASSEDTVHSTTQA